MGFTVESLDTIDGNIFNALEDAIIVPINCVGGVGRGIAKEFFENNPEIRKIYKANVLNEEYYTQRITLHKVKYGHAILFATKKHFKDRAVKELIIANLNRIQLSMSFDWDNIESIAIPPLGLGNGWLGKSWVKELVVVCEQLFKEMEVNVVLYLTEDQMKLI